MPAKSRNILYGIFAFGVLSRAVNYCHNRSFWFDEAAKALKVVHFSVRELFDPLSMAGESHFIQIQAGPVGFFLISKLSVFIFGVSEFALRLFPFLCGLLSIYAFYALLNKCLKNEKMILAALALFAVSEHIIYYTTEFKPYITDVLMAIVLSLSFLKLYQSRMTIKEFGILFVAGTVSVLFSLPAMFVLAGGCIGVGSAFLLEKNYLKAKQLLALCFFWLIACAGYYYRYLKVFTDDQNLKSHFQGLFAPIYPLHMYGIPWYTVKWYAYTFVKIFKNPVGLSIPLLGALLFIAGIIYLKKTNRHAGGILFWPVLVTLLASALHKYPFYGRTILFLVPALIVFIFAGLEYIDARLQGKRSIWITAILFILLIHPVLSAGYNIWHPIEREEIKPVMAHLKAKRANERIYLYFGAEYGFRYYAPRYGFSDQDYVIGRNLKENFGEYTVDLDSVRKYDKVWLVFSHVYRDDERAFLKYLDQYGKQKDAYQATHAAVYLYEFH